jgi:hypothetical protein
MTTALYHERLRELQGKYRKLQPDYLVMVTLRDSLEVSNVNMLKKIAELKLMLQKQTTKGVTK